MRRFTNAERRARLGVRHALAPGSRAPDPAAAAEAVVALHATDPASVHLAAWARLPDGTGLDAVGRALYDERSLVRVMGMRRTMFAAPPATAAIITAACGRDVAARERRRLVRLLTDAGAGGADPDAWLRGAEEAAVAALRLRGTASAAELATDDERLAVELVVGRGTRTEARQKLVSRLLTVLAAHGHVVRARPPGTWTSTRVRWAPLDAWCPQAMPSLDAEAARAALARRWLRAFGPATAEDLRWWTGWGPPATRAALAAAGAVAVDLEGAPGVALADDLEPVAAPAPWAALLPALDPTTMGVKHRGFYLGERERRLFDVNGNASPTVWWDGRVVGGWAQRPDGEILLALLEDVGRDARAAIDAAAARLRAVLGDERPAPRARGRSPVEAELVARRS